MEAQIQIVVKMMIKSVQAKRVIMALSAVAVGSLSLSLSAGAETMATFNQDGYSFKYPQSWGKAVMKTVKAQAQTDPTEIPDGINPEYKEFSFSTSKALIDILPVKDAATPQFKKKYSEVAESTKALKTLLAKHPAAPKEIPIVPWEDTATPFTVHLKYLDYKDKNAVRFVAQYGIEPGEINNEDLRYRTQGLSKDAKYYISAAFPVSTTILPAKDSAAKWSKEKYAQFSKTFDSYGAGVGKKLAALPENSFKPTLADLDACVESIAVAK